ncbi:MAG: rhomboid family intramembrane serine protease [Bacteroidetes bacterium]|nr:rhomboid family intramembrane serine protease [Bacteroidota bacterium]
MKLDGMKPQHALLLAYAAMKKLDWEVSFIGENAIIAHVDRAWWYSMGEQVFVYIENDNLYIKSESNTMIFFDWFTNLGNVKKITREINAYKEKNTAEHLEEKLPKLLKASEKYANDSSKITAGFLANKVKNKSSIFSIFIPKDGFFITPILVSINILMFFVMVISGVSFFNPSGSDLLDWGACSRPPFADGQWWRLLSATFLHAGFLHLFFNMYGLVFVGYRLEPYLGRAKFLAAYLVTGLVGSLASLWWNEFVISVGASGAIFGMFGVFLALMSTDTLSYAMKRTFFISTAFFTLYSISNGFKPNSGIDNAAHIGGILSGILVGFAFIPSFRYKDNRRLESYTLMGLSAAITVVISLTIFYPPASFDMADFDKAMMEVSTLEAEALEVFSLPADADRDEILDGLQAGIPLWKKSIGILKRLDNQLLPKPLAQHTKLLSDYCEARLRSYQLMAKGIEEKTDQYGQEIAYYNQQIEGIAVKLGGGQ